MTSNNYTRGTLRKPAPEPLTDWGWYIIGAIMAVVALAYGGMWLADRIIQL